MRGSESAMGDPRNRDALHCFCAMRSTESPTSMNQPISPTPVAEQLALATPAPASSGGNQAEVCVYIGLEFAAKYAIEQGEYVLGRDPGCHIVLDTDGVSRRHAR